MCKSTTEKNDYNHYHPNITKGCLLQIKGTRASVPHKPSKHLRGANNGAEGGDVFHHEKCVTNFADGLPYGLGFSSQKQYVSHSQSHHIKVESHESSRLWCTRDGRLVNYGYTQDVSVSCPAWCSRKKAACQFSSLPTNK